MHGDAALADRRDEAISFGEVRIVQTDERPRDRLGGGARDAPLHGDARDAGQAVDPALHAAIEEGEVRGFVLAE